MKISSYMFLLTSFSLLVLYFLYSNNDNIAKINIKRNLEDNSQDDCSLLTTFNDIITCYDAFVKNLTIKYFKTGKLCDPEINLKFTEDITSDLVYLL